MRLQTLIGTGLLVTVTALVTSRVTSQQPPAPAESGHDTPDAESLVETWVRFAMPGEHHKLLAKMAGTWQMQVRYRMSADTPPVESKGSCTRKWVLGNRFLFEEFDGGSLAVPFQGLAIYGYDAFEQKYTSVWIDTTSTAITTNLGTCRDTGCSQIDFLGQHGDSWSGKKKRCRGVTRLVDDNRHVLELYEPGADGKEFRVLEIIYTRARPAPL